MSPPHPPSSAPLPPIVAIVGNKKSGKTTVTVGLLAELSARGHLVMSVKHGHHFRLDREGTDSWRHRHEGGAERVVLAGPDEVAVTGGWGGDGEPSLREIVRRYLADAEIVVAEGFRAEPVHRIEIYRSGVHPDPITRPEAIDPDRQIAVVTDRSDLPWPVPVLDPDRPDLPARLADLVEARLLR
jgi:molybdopterin-guanine dinucleotide biosynthesis protein B